MKFEQKSSRKKPKKQQLKAAATIVASVEPFGLA
jgi:hypothetical protein